jgi:uncharacterized protein YbcV (DUF1398 family)
MMDAKTRHTLQECTDGSDDGRFTFPEVVGKLIAAGVEQYHADLRRNEKTYYLPDNESLVVPTGVIRGSPAPDFSAAGVQAAIRAIQANQVSYVEFCERIVAAGCVGYFVSIAGRRAVYFGRTCDSYVEPFPVAK